MALVIAGREPRGPAADRGQVLFVMALGLAVLLVVLSVTINSTVVTGRLGPDGVATDPSSNAVRFQLDAREAVGDAMDHVNENDVSYADLETDLDDSVTRWSTLSARHAASDGSYISAAVLDTTRGTKIAQTNATLALTNADGNETWTLANDTAARAVTMDLAGDSLSIVHRPNPTVATLENASVFTVVVDDRSDPVRVFVYQSAADTAAIAVDSGDGTLDEPCTVPLVDGRVVVDFASTTVAGERCAALEALGTVGDHSAVEFRNGGSAVGTYSLVVDRPLAAVADGDFASPGHDGGPTASRAIYSVTVRSTYHTSDIRSSADLRVAPGEIHG